MEIQQIFAKESNMQDKQPNKVYGNIPFIEVQNQVKLISGIKNQDSG